jgi:hypothetical protein
MFGGSLQGVLDFCELSDLVLQAFSVLRPVVAKIHQNIWRIGPTTTK